MNFTGRRQIFTDEKEITKDNICKVLCEALFTHMGNAARIEYLEKYEQGIQPILQREKPVRPDINNKIVVNHAAEIVDFKTSYIFGSPMTLVQARRYDKGTAERDDAGIAELNEMFDEQSKAASDAKLARQLMVCGAAYRMALAKDEKRANDSEISPFEILPLDAKTTFCVYSNDVFKRKLLGVSYAVKENGELEIGAYTDKEMFFLHSPGLLAKNVTLDEGSVKANGFGIIPIAEYTTKDRMGVFEKAISILDAINTAESDRVNALAQYVQSFLWLNNCEIDEAQYAALRENGCIQTTSTDGTQASITYLQAPLDQTATQALIDDLYARLLCVTAVPGREQSSGGNTGTAIELGAAGWALADADAKGIETKFAADEKQFLRIVLALVKSCKPESAAAGLKLGDIEPKFSRNKTANLLTKTQGLLNQLTAGIAPQVAIKNCDLYSDPQQVYIDSEAQGGFEKWKEKTGSTAQSQPQTEDDNNRAAQSGGTVQKED